MSLDDVADGIAECGMQSWLPDSIPSGRHPELRALLYDLAVAGLHALASAGEWYLPGVAETGEETCDSTT
jgi:hypothetical protein